MSDIVLHTAAKASTVPTRVAHGVRRAVQRLREEERGQDMVEYAGVLLVVAIVVVGVAAAISNGGVFGDIAGGIRSVVDNIFQGKSPNASPGSAQISVSTTGH